MATETHVATVAALARAHRRAFLVAALRGSAQLQIGLGLLLGFVGIALAALAHFGAGLTTLPVNFAWQISDVPPGPSALHPFGVMRFIGVDELDALWRAAPIDLVLVLGPILLAALVGVLLGSYAGYSAGAADLVITFASDILVSVPPFFLVFVLYLGVFRFLPPGKGLPVFAGLLAFVLWPYYARPVRARAMQVATEPYVEAARAAGAPRARLLGRHVIPNSFAPVFAQVPVDVYNVFFVLTVFQFLPCLGGFFGTLSALPAAPYPEWGYLLANGACYGWSVLASNDFWWMYTFPALVILVFGVAVALTCDGAERILSPVRARG